MKPEIRFKLPLISYRNKPVFFGIKGSSFYGEYNGGNSIFIFHSNVLIALVCLVPFFLLFFGERPQQVKNVYTLVQGNSQEILNYEDFDDVPVLPEDPDFLFDEELEAVENELFQQTSHEESKRARFIKEREKLIYRFKKNAKQWRLEDMDNATLGDLNKQISNLFIRIILDNSKVEKHVYKYFTDPTDLYKLETALMEQVKYHVPASITLAQSALETGYGSRIIHNNFFGIKSKVKNKSKNAPLSVTTEYYTDQELKRNKSKVISKKKVYKNGKYFWQCRIKDHFVVYNNAWESFRDHSKFLSENERYHPLFVGGKNYQAWADKIGSTKYGGVGYATSPLYGKLLKGIIRRYHLDLLDY
ncbi:glycoside hydrolase family 73 protein [Chondrinema litorale]|uniref:glycoside hydrolase family 73 protein n=1 Tax=Chondrinema litorale TaxID=2994555 RepID=UPI002542B799|nr:glucosaminidase domain-containing protein [Chondrinema litorale]UZR92567.1 glucosaminidase domain-containing protein [Chondrinema litorale]